MKAEREARLQIEREGGGSEYTVQGSGTRAWFKDSWEAIKKNWVLCKFTRLPTLRDGRCADSDFQSRVHDPADVLL